MTTPPFRPVPMPPPPPHTGNGMAMRWRPDWDDDPVGIILHAVGHHVADHLPEDEQEYARMAINRAAFGLPPRRT